MTLLANKVTWKLFSGLTIAVVGLLAKKMVDQSWKIVVKDEPPRNLAAEDVSFRTAALWTIASALTTSMAIMLAKRGAANEWKKTTGKHPPA